ncbi:hypothetical protein [Streptomyces sp. b94]|uniref:hypothetical protein n=1 Tax=Streptomyces sp. b94 TaxID=1827634 RepID=UPI0015CF230A|nr:hypothetical protein [Streptomyces sp. b94]
MIIARRAIAKFSRPSTRWRRGPGPARSRLRGAAGPRGRPRSHQAVSYTHL